MIIKQKTKFELGEKVFTLDVVRAFGNVVVKENTISSIEMYIRKDEVLWFYRLSGDACAYFERRLFKTREQAEKIARRINKYLTNRD